MSETYTAKIRLEGEDAGLGGMLHSIIGSIEGLTGKAAVAGLALESWGEIFKEVAEAGLKVVETLSDMTAELIKATAEQEKHEMKIASSYGKTMEWGDSLARAKQILPELEKAAATTGAKVQDLTSSFRDMKLLTGSSDEAVIKFTKDLTVMAETAGVSVTELVSSITRAAMTGQLQMRGGAGRLIAMLIGSGEEIQQAHELGNLISFVSERLGDMKERTDSLSTSWDALIKGIKQAGENIREELGNSFNPLKQVFLDIRGAMLSDALKEMVENVTHLAAGIIATKLDEWWRTWVAIRETIRPLAQEFLALKQAITGIQDGWEGSAGSSAEKGKANPPAETMNKTLEAYRKLVAELSRKNDLAGLEGVQKQLQEVANENDRDIERLLEAWQKTGGSYAEFKAGMEQISERTRKKESAINAAAAADAQKTAEAVMAAQAKASLATQRGLEKWGEEMSETLAFLEDSQKAHEDTMLSITDDSYQKQYALIERDFERRKAAINRIKDLSDEEKRKLIENAREEADARQAQLAREENSWEGYRRKVGQALEYLLKYTDSFGAGVAAGFLKIKLTVESTTERISTLTAETWAAMGTGFQTAFYDVLTGRFDSLKDAFQSMWNGIAQSFAKMLSGMLQDWLVAQMAMKNSSSFGLGGVGGVGGYLMAGGLGYGVGSTIGGFSGAPGFNTGASIGGLVGGVALGGIGSSIATGLGIGSIVPGIGNIIGAIIGAIVGGLIAVFASPNTEMKQRIIGSTREGQTILNPIGNTMAASALGIYGTTGLGDRRGFGQSVNDAIRRYLLGSDYEIHAGSVEDMEGDYKTLLTRIVPQELLHVLFGQQRVGGKDVAGISGASSFAGAYATDDGPYVKMLKALGFTERAVQNIAAQIDLRAPEEFLKYLNALVGVVVGFHNLTKDLGKSTGDWFAEFAANESKSPAAAFAAGAQNLIDLAGELDLYAGDEQIAKAQQLLQLGEQYRDQQVAYIKQLYDLQRGISNSVEDQLRSMRLDTMTEPQKEAYYGWEINRLMGDIAKANTPEEIQRAFSRISQNASAMWNSGKGSFSFEYIENILRAAQQAADDRIKALGDAALAPNQKLNDALEKARALFTGLSDATLPAHTAATDGDTSAVQAHEAATRASISAIDGLRGAAVELRGTLREFSTWISDGGFVGFVVEAIRQDPTILTQGTGD